MDEFLPELHQVRRGIFGSAWEQDSPVGELLDAADRGVALGRAPNDRVRQQQAMQAVEKACQATEEYIEGLRIDRYLSEVARKPFRAPVY